MNSRGPQTDIAKRKDAVEPFHGGAENLPVVEIDEAKRAERLLAGENRLLELIAKGCALAEILDALCRVIEELCSESLCGILLVDPAAKRVEHGAGPSLPQGYNEAIHGRTLSIDAGPCGMAASRNQQVIAADIASDTRWQADWRDLAVAHGLRACWSTPILSSDGAVLGTFAIYWREPRRPTAEDQKIIQHSTHLAAVAIERKRTESALRESEVEGQAHLWFLEGMDRINRAIQGRNDLEQMMSDVLKAVLSIFHCDRAWLVYPCDPKAVSWRAVMEHVHPGFPGAFALGVDLPVDPEVADVFARVRGSTNCVCFGPGSDDPVPAQLAERFSIQSMIGQAIYPKRDKPYMFGLHQCSFPRLWTPQEQRLFQEIGRRMADALSTLLLCHSLQNSEARLEEAQRITHVGYWERDLETDFINWSNETYRIFGLSPQEGVLHVSELPNLIHPEDRHIMPEAVAEALRGGGRYNAEYRVIRPSGEVRFVHSMGEVVKDESGRRRRMFGTAQDITERKQAAEALRASEHLARGQLAALTGTLDSLAQESDPDKLLKHVVTTILKQMDAHSATIWERHGDALDLLGIIEEGRFKTRHEAGYFDGSLPVVGQAPPLWVEALRTAAYTVLEDINKEPTRILLGDGRAAVWRGADLTRPFADLKAHLTTQGVRALLISPMMFAGQLAGIIGIRFIGMRAFRMEEIELTKALAHQAMLALQLMRLSQQSRQAAVEAERNRLARDIHDTLAQGFTGVIIQLEAAADAASKGLATESDAHLSRAAHLAREGLNEARRSVRALRPQALDGNSLGKALGDLIGNMTDGTTMRGEFTLHGQTQPLPPEWDENLLRVGQEVLTNALRHAQASEFDARLVFDSNEVRLELRDNGRGFDPSGKHDGFGLLGIKERVEGLGGKCRIESGNGRGTSILILLPLPDQSISSPP